MLSTAESEHRFPQGLIKHPYHMHSFAVDMPPWTRHLGMSGRAERRLMRLIIRADGLPLQRDICSYCGAPAGLHWHPAKTSGSKGIWWKTASSYSDSWGQRGAHIYPKHPHIFLIMHAEMYILEGTHTHTYAGTYTKAWRKMGAIWPPGSLPAAHGPCWVCPVGAPALAASCTAGCLGDAVLETIRLGVVWRPRRPCPSDRPQRQNVSQAQAYALRHGRLCGFLCNCCSHGLNLKGPEK